MTLWDRNTKGGRPAPSVGDVREQVKDEMHLVVVIVTKPAVKLKHVMDYMKRT